MLACTNKGYALSLTISEMPLINRVARAYIDKKVGPDAPLWDKELAYEEWCMNDYDEEGWSRARIERANFINLV